MINKNAIELHNRLSNGLRGVHVESDKYFIKRGEIMDQAFKDGLITKRYIPECPIHVSGMIQQVTLTFNFTNETGE